jgi:hypothetical protein
MSRSWPERVTSRFFVPGPSDAVSLICGDELDGAHMAALCSAVGSRGQFRQENANLREGRAGSDWRD